MYVGGCTPGMCPTEKCKIPVESTFVASTINRIANAGFYSWSPEYYSNMADGAGFDVEVNNGYIKKSIQGSNSFPYGFDQVLDLARELVSKAGCNVKFDKWPDDVQWTPT